MAIGANWKEVWGPVWKAVWSPTAPTSLDISASPIAITGTVGVTGDIQIGTSFDLVASPLALSGAVAITGDIAAGTSFDLAASPLALSGALSVSGDIAASETPIAEPAVGGAVAGFTRYRSSPREKLPPLVEPVPDEELMAEVQEVLAALFSLEVFT